jgi:hypothetical protein
MAAGLIHELGIPIKHRARENEAEACLNFPDDTPEFEALFDPDEFITELLRRADSEVSPNSPTVWSARNQFRPMG